MIICRDMAVVTDKQLDQISCVFEKSFNVVNARIALTDYIYKSNMSHVAMYLEGGVIKAFMFYRRFVVSGKSILVYGLSGKDTLSSSIQKKMGMSVFLETFSKWFYRTKTIYFCTVSNNPKSYKNMLYMGGSVYPNFSSGTDSEISISDHEYLSISRLVDVKVSGPDGLVENRCTSLGFFISKEEERSFDSSSVSKRFYNAINENSDNGVFVVIRFRIFSDIFRYLYRSIVPRRRKYKRHSVV